jgi:toxin YhaV
LKAIVEVALNRIPQDPSNPRYRVGGALGDDKKHWFSDSFGKGRYRIFFRYDSKTKIIIFAWVNDEQTLRTYGSNSDAYKVFASMLASKNPPDSWDDLKKAVEAPDVIKQASEAIQPLKA